MKLFSFTILAFTLITFTSCSKDFSEEIIGTWTLESAEIENCPNEGITGLAVTATEGGCVTMREDETCLTMSFAENNTGSYVAIENGDTYAEAYTYTIDDTTETGEICFENECFTLEMDDDVIVFRTVEDGCPLFFTLTKQ